VRERNGVDFDGLVSVTGDSKDKVVGDLKRNGKKKVELDNGVRGYSVLYSTNVIHSS
jgi:hypothetical protein